MQRAFTIFAAACGVAAVLVLSAWAVSYRRIRGWRASASDHVTWTGSSGDGQLDLRRTAREPVGFGQGHWAYFVPAGPRGVRVPGLVVQRTVAFRWLLNPGESGYGPPTPLGRLRFDSVLWQVRVDYWLPSLLLATPPLVWIDCRRRRRQAVYRRSTGRCADCGYDLRATPAQCPECGRPGPASRVSASGTPSDA